MQAGKRSNIFRAIALLLVLVLTGAAQQQGPVAKFTFNSGTIEDETGRHHPKAYNLLTARDRFGNDACAMFFKGNEDSFLNLGTEDDLKPRAGTISLWAKIEQVIYKGKGIFANPFIVVRAHDGEDFTEAYAMGYNFAIKRLGAANSRSDTQQTHVYQLDTAKLQAWYHVAMTYDDRDIYFYLNGVLQGRAHKNFASHFLEGDSVRVGCHVINKNRRYFQGTIDDIEIYNRVLSPDEIYSLYKASDPNKTGVIMKWVLVALLILAGAVLISWWVRYRIRKGVTAEKEKSKLNNRILELETKAIRAQMNPHFMFNALNTLQRFILKDDKDKSYTYLIELSRLLRKLLKSSESETISLHEEMEILNAYLKIEKLRFGDSFDYRVISDIEAVHVAYIPIMFIQPFAENAIWHGLLNKNGKRLLTIHFKDFDERRILCEIEDNGVGRNFRNKAPDDLKKKSLAIDMIRQRLELTCRATGVDCSLEIIDKTDEQGGSLGTLVKIVLPKW